MQAWRGWVLAGCLILGSGAAAQAPADAMVQQLREQGYVSFEVSRTLLGRTRVVALTADGGRREIVFSPATGEILRDYYEAADGTSAPMVLDRPDDDSSDAARERDSDGGSIGPDNDGPSRSADQDNRPLPHPGRGNSSDAHDDRPHQQGASDDVRQNGADRGRAPPRP